MHGYREGYLEYRGGCSVPQRYSNTKRFIPHGTEHPPTVLKLSPHGTEHTLYRVIFMLGQAILLISDRAFGQTGTFC